MTATMTKAARVSIKAAGPGEDPSLEEGQFLALVSVFNNVDSYGDVVVPGAFKDTLAEWEASGDPIPVVWAHQWADPDAHIGVVVKAWETDEGLMVLGQLDTDEEARKARQVYRLLKGRRITQFSFAFDVIDGGWGEREDREVFELRALKVHEVGPCLVGVNQETALRDVKAVRAGFPPAKGAEQDPGPSGTGTSEDPSSQAEKSAASEDEPRSPSASASPLLDPASVATLADLHEIL